MTAPSDGVPDTPTALQVSNDDYLAAPGAKLTREVVRRAIEKMKAPPVYRICGNLDYHVVHPKAQGWTTCANCFSAVFVPVPAVPVDKPQEEQP